MRATLENLKPYRKGEERARVNGRKGGINSGIKRRYQRDQKEKFKSIMMINEMSQEEILEIAKELELNQEQIDYINSFRIEGL